MCVIVAVVVFIAVVVVALLVDRLVVCHCFVACTSAFLDACLAGPSVGCSVSLSLFFLLMLLLLLMMMMVLLSSLLQLWSLLMLPLQLFDSWLWSHLSSYLTTLLLLLHICKCCIMLVCYSCCCCYYDSLRACDVAFGCPVFGRIGDRPGPLPETLCLWLSSSLLVLMWSLVLPVVVRVIGLILRLVLLVQWKAFVWNTRSYVVVPVVKIRAKMTMAKEHDKHSATNDLSKYESMLCGG